MTTTIILLVATLMLAGCEACHNSTSACHHNGKFERLDGSMVTHAQRCVEDCKDGMHEFMCPRAAPGHHEEASCGPSCACTVDTTWVLSDYFNFATYAPTVGGRWSCNPTGATLTNCAREMVGCGPQRVGWTACSPPRCVVTTFKPPAATKCPLDLNASNVNKAACDIDTSDTTPVTGVMQQPNVFEASSTVNYYLPVIVLQFSPGVFFVGTEAGLFFPNDAWVRRRLSSSTPRRRSFSPTSR